MASDEFSNHGCNDFDLPNTPENLSLTEKAEKYCFVYDAIPTISKDGKRIFTEDVVLMQYFAHLARELAGHE